MKYEIYVSFCSDLALCLVGLAYKIFLRIPNVSENWYCTSLSGIDSSVLYYPFPMCSLVKVKSVYPTLCSLLG